jgi:hypothetical protein
MNMILPMRLLALAALATVIGASQANAAFIVETHSSGKANATNFAIIPGAGNATGASASVASTAVGLAGTNSIFSTNNTIAGTLDVYQFSYTPGTNADNTVLAAATSLGNSSAVDADGAGATAPVYANVPQLASGLTGGVSGFYRVYFTAPSSANVNAAGSRFDITNDLATVTLNPVNLNDGNTGPDEVAGTPFTGGANNRWLHIATVKLTAGTTYTVTVTSNADSFVSQRAQGVMWEMAVPEPSSLVMALMTGVGSLGVIRRRLA